MAGKAHETRQILASLVEETLNKCGKRPCDRFYREFVTQVLNYIWGRNYRKEWMDFTTDDPPFIDWYARGMLVTMVEVLQTFRTDLPSDEARERLDHIATLTIPPPSSKPK
jgi:hypothetical protein